MTATCFAGVAAETCQHKEKKLFLIESVFFFHLNQSATITMLLFTYSIDGILTEVTAVQISEK